MDLKQEQVPKDIETAIREIIRRDMEPFGFRDCRVEPGENHDGEPVIYVAVDYDSDGPPVDPKCVAGLVGKLRNRLWELGETRFPHVRHGFSENREVVGYSR